ncbi:MAG: L,D-transpeptidase, partial [Lachnospiraceae bacterium]|nr:L,D-transpeptidase [Lachnospiraceae bacterium]
LAGLAVLALAGTPAVPAQAASKYEVEVNVTANVITVYENGTPIRAMTCSTGEDTPRKGTRHLREKYRWKNLYHNSYGQYCTRYDDHMLFHSVPYMGAEDNSTLSGGLFDRLGTPDSMGCIRMLCGDAKWFYDTVPTGTKVSFYCDKDNAGPLGFPYCSSRRDIPMNGGFDPTDPAENNDWNRYYQSAFDADYYLANNPDLMELDKHWTDVTLKLHWVMEGMHEGRQASPYFNVNAYKEAHPEYKEIYGDTNFKYVIQYNADVAKGTNVPESLTKAQAGEAISNTYQKQDGSIITITSLADGRTYRQVTAPDGTVTASITKQEDNGSVTTSPVVIEQQAAPAEGQPAADQSAAGTAASAADQSAADTAAPAADQQATGTAASAADQSAAGTAAPAAGQPTTGTTPAPAPAVPVSGDPIMVVN